MTAVNNSIITTLLLYLFASQEKVYTDVLVKDDTGKITCDVPGGEENFVWYKYEEYFVKKSTWKTYEVQSGDGIFACGKKIKNSSSLEDVSCESHNIRIIPLITGNYANVSNFTKKIGQNVTFQSQFNNTYSYTLLWIVKQQNVSKCIYSAAATRSISHYSLLLNKLCCSSGDKKGEERIQFQNLTPFHEPHQKLQLDLVNLTSSDSGAYLCIIYFWDGGHFKWNILNKYFLEVTGYEDAISKPAPICIHDASSKPCAGSQGPTERDGQRETPFSLIAGPIGGFIAVLVILLLSIFWIKKRGKQKKMIRSSPVVLSDEYECMPYAVSERKEELRNSIYSVAQNPVPTTDAEYSEVQLTNLGLSSAHRSESSAKAKIVSEAKYAEVIHDTNMKEDENDACAVYSVVNINTI